MSTLNLTDFDTFTKIAQNERDLGKLIVDTDFEKLPNIQYIAKSGHTAANPSRE